MIFVLLCGTSGDLHEMISLDMLFSTSILVALGDVLTNDVNRGSEPTRNWFGSWAGTWTKLYGQCRLYINSRFLWKLHIITKDNYYEWSIIIIVLDPNFIILFRIEIKCSVLTKELLPRTLTACPWKMLLGKLFSFWNGPFSGDILWFARGVSIHLFYLKRSTPQSHCQKPP